MSFLRATRTPDGVTICPQDVEILRQRYPEGTRRATGGMGALLSPLVDLIDSEELAPAVNLEELSGEGSTTDVVLVPFKMAPFTRIPGRTVLLGRRVREGFCITYPEIQFPQGRVGCLFHEDGCWIVPPWRQLTL